MEALEGLAPPSRGLQPRALLLGHSAVNSTSQLQPGNRIQSEAFAKMGWPTDSHPYRILHRDEC